VRVIVVCVPNGSDVIEYELANPEIYYTGGGTQSDWEGCLSYPTGFRARVLRPRKIKVRALNKYHEPIEFSANQLVARCLQHEIDHLDGILITDKATRTDQRKKKELT
jgi:peptide deformylase